MSFVTAELRIVMIEDQESEAELALNHLRQAGRHCVAKRVETEAELRHALATFAPDVILSDFTLPQFDGMSALAIARETAPDVPFIFVSGTIGEERAIEALRCGATDYVLKSNLRRLAPAVQRAQEEAEIRREHRRQEAQIARLNRVLRMLSGVNSLVVRIRDRSELLQETCRLAVSVGGYTAAIACWKTPGSPTLQPVIWSAIDDKTAEPLRAAVTDAGTRDTSIVGRVLKTGQAYICKNTQQLEGTATFSRLLLATGQHALAALPLLVDDTPVGVLLLTARDSEAVGDEELHMLREVAGNLSFALQYLSKDTRVRFLSHFDPQTGLAKRSLFVERIARLIGSPAGHRNHHMVAIIDVEQLSVINDSFGRRTGDLLLQHVADRLKRRLPHTEQLAHFGGGTFGIAYDIGNQSSDEWQTRAREQIAVLLNEPFVIEGRQLPIAVRTGFAIYPEDGNDANTLVQNAETALRNARVSGERQLHYSAQKHTEMVGRLALEHKLRLALERREYELHYQPKVNVITRRIEGVEALVRWRDPESGLVAPGVFLPVLEASGLILDVSDWILQQAAADCQQWLREGLPPMRIAVNISPQQLRLPDFAASFLRITEGWSTARSGLDIEITEGALQEDSAADVRKLKLLRSNGVRIAIDDFGTGYSSLSRLAVLPIDTLKIDRAFVMQVPQDTQGKILVKTIITLARGFGMTTVAEGVETQEQLDFLWQMACDQSQGNLHSKAVSSREFVQLLQYGKGRLILPPAPEEENQAESESA